jgi:hypothetical protein
VITGKLKEVTDDFSKKLQDLFSEKLSGVYLTGPAALGGYCFGKSGVEFTVMLR